MARGAWILDPVSGNLIESGEYYANLAERRGRCRTGSPQVIADWQTPVRNVVEPGGGMITSRRDQRELMARTGTECVGNDSAFANPKPPPPPEPKDPRPFLRDVAYGEVSEDYTAAARKVDTDGLRQL